MSRPRHVQADSHVFVLTDVERAEIRLLAERLVAVEPRLVDHADWLSAAADYSCHLPVRLRERFRRFRTDQGARGLLGVRGLPVHAEGPTPSEVGSVVRDATVSAAVLSMCMLSLGEIVAFRSEKSGALIQNVVPVPGRERQQSNAGSRRLEMHVENVHHENRPDLVSLLCLRNDHDDAAGLRVASIREALSLVAPRLRRILAEPRFSSAPPPSFSGAGESPIHPVLQGAYEDPDIRVDFANTVALDAEAADAMNELKRALEAVCEELVLEVGDLAIVDNRITLHGRTAFSPRYDGNDRWLQRAFVHLDHRRTRGVREGDGKVIA